MIQAFLYDNGDIFERILPNGSVEEYEVLEFNCRKGLLQIPDSYDISVRKTTSKKKCSF